MSHHWMDSKGIGGNKMDERITTGEGFTIICNKCGSQNCRVEANSNYEYIEVNLVCDDCNYVS